MCIPVPWLTLGIIGSDACGTRIPGTNMTVLQLHFYVQNATHISSRTAASDTTGLKSSHLKLGLRVQLPNIGNHVLEPNLIFSRHIRSGIMLSSVLKESTLLLSIPFMDIPALQHRTTKPATACESGVIVEMPEKVTKCPSELFMTWAGMPVK